MDQVKALAKEHVDQVKALAKQHVDQVLGPQPNSMWTRSRLLGPQPNSMWTRSRLLGPQPNSMWTRSRLLGPQPNSQGACGPGQGPRSMWTRSRPKEHVDQVKALRSTLKFPRQTAFSEGFPSQSRGGGGVQKADVHPQVRKGRSFLPRAKEAKGTSTFTRSSSTGKRKDSKN